jgi:hypothetical protein
VEWLHPVAVEQEVTVDVEVARVVLGDLSAESLHDIVAVEVLLDPVKLIVAQASTLALLANIVNVLTSLLEWTDESIVTVDAGRDTRPDRLTVVTALNKALAAVERVVHALALLLAENSGPTAITTGHWAVVFVLSEAISETVTNQDGLQVDVALLVRKNLRSEDRNVVTGVGLA